MNDFSKFNKIRNVVNRGMEQITNASEVSNECGFRSLHILWLYPDVMNIHGGRGDIMGLLHISNLLGIPVIIKRCDSLKQNIDWSWAHMAYMTAGELKCAPDVISALKRQKDEIDDFVSRGGTFIANGSSGAVLANTVELFGGKIIKGLDLLHMDWKERDRVWGDDIWVKVIESDEGSEADGGNSEDKFIDVIGNQIQVADVTLLDGQEAFGELVYGRGNDGSAVEGGSGFEGARSGNVIYTGVLGPLMTKNPLLAASILKKAAKTAGIKNNADITAGEIETELESAKYIKNFMKDKLEQSKS